MSALWSDATVARGHTASGGNALMYAVTERAIRKAKGRTFRTPPELLDRLLPDVHDYAATITEEPDLRLTFTLNALVPSTMRRGCSTPASTRPTTSCP